jgi:hypothetical protein
MTVHLQTQGVEGTVIMNVLLLYADVDSIMLELQKTNEKSGCLDKPQIFGLVHCRALGYSGF